MYVLLRNQGHGLMSDHAICSARIARCQLPRLPQNALLAGWMPLSVSSRLPQTTSAPRFEAWHTLLDDLGVALVEHPLEIGSQVQADSDSGSSARHRGFKEGEQQPRGLSFCRVPLLRHGFQRCASTSPWSNGSSS